MQTRTHLDDRVLREIAGFMESATGVQLPPSKMTLVRGRISRLLSQRGVEHLPSFLNAAFSAGTPESEELIDCLTTNKTHFMREPEQIEVFRERAVPELMAEGRRSIRLWSAGCSTGQEPYSLAMAMHTLTPRPDYRISASDICTRALRRALRAIYPDDAVADVPLDWRRACLLRSSDPSRPYVTLRDEIKERVTFEKINLVRDPFIGREAFDVIFCRNTMIYFCAETRARLVERFERVLAPGGWLFVGHSEGLGNASAHLERVAPSVYRRPGS